MIPKTIHYCWFGRKPLPKPAIICLESWRKYLPDYRIVEWNEDNFDVNAIPYTAHAHKAGKYAFVSDYARFRILYEHGGLYFDTDVEIIRPLDDIIAAGAFMGFETDCGPTEGAVAPGLGIGAEKGNPILKAIIDRYATLAFTVPRGTTDTPTVVVHTTEVLRRFGLRNLPGIQRLDGLTLYPAEYFNPWEWKTGRPHPTPNTRSIHWYAQSWTSPSERFKTHCRHWANRIFGRKTIACLKHLLEFKELRFKS